MKRAKTVLNFPNSGLKSRDLVLGIDAFGVSRAYPVERLLRDQLTEDRLGGQPILIVVGPDRNLYGCSKPQCTPNRPCRITIGTQPIRESCP